MRNTACRMQLAGGRERGRILPAASCKGFTLIELVVVIIVVVVLMALFLDRVTYYREQAEKTAMESVAGAIQSALTMQFGHLMTRGQPSDVEALVRDNPMNWLQKRPQNYAGEFYAPTPLSVEGGNWVFDLASRELVYVPRTGEYFKPGKDGKKWIRFRVEAQYDPSRLPSLRDEPPQLTGLVLQPVEPYAWF